MIQENSFTKRVFESLKTPEKRYRVPDFGHRESVNGLFLEVMPSGKKVFRFRRKHLGKDTSVTIGEFPNVTIENARKLAKQIAYQFSSGENPNEAKRQAKEELARQEALAMTVQELFDAWVIEFQLRIKVGERRAKSLQDALSTWSNHLQEPIGGLPISAIDVSEAENLLKRILIKTSGSVRNKCLTLMKSLYAGQGENPFAKIRKLTEVKRERILNQDEMQRLLAALEDEPEIHRDIVMMLLLTGQRKSCVLSMEWHEIDHQRGIWLIPTSKMKAKKAHAVPLTKEAMEILQRRSSNAEAGQKYVFPSLLTKVGHVTERSGEHSFWYRITEKAGLRGEGRGESVTIHDLRRTIASWSVMRGGNIQTTSKLLGHSDISITASTYAHLDIEQVRRELGITTAQLLGTAQHESKVDRLVREIESLTTDEKMELFSRCN
ncbi:tyrosine-type recombinase/integrase [Shewanella yunxiaonensis]|uniref:Tyrosine-type recombinase/integrase n=1 Tax=Shewanella yunxiaonensis TaxID=2829809 RepID=A0ABX7YVV7_9GAMM|nr:site-specific integrase [Shewanella yunxiaonensis]QUN06817.1 tyrosine-type recombinase/integrase [Shewanella yunxiaonensis]